MIIIRILLFLITLLSQFQITEQALREYRQRQLLAPLLQAIEDDECSKPPEVIPDFPDLFGDERWKMQPNDNEDKT